MRRGDSPTGVHRSSSTKADVLPYRAALRPVPSYAVVEPRHVENVSETLGDDETALQDALDRGFHELDVKQPALAHRATTTLTGIKDELVQALGYFLTVSVYLAFREAFPTRLTTVDDDALRVSAATLDADEEFRKRDPREQLETDDIVAMGQPAILGFVQHHVDQALEQGGEDVDLVGVDTVYRFVLLEVIALSHAVADADGRVGPRREAMA